MNWILLVTQPARKALARLPERDQHRIVAAMDRMAEDPFTGDIKRLEPDAWRRRVGNYRIFYDLDIDERTIVVTGIERRTSTTY
ncbi:MAG TPA: type II toxin-antitoxin system RelE/ParE family toxin [Bryobacteraceae bacterium]